MGSITTHHRWYSCELYSIGQRNYFGYNGTLYTLTPQTLNEVLNEVKNMNPEQCAQYLIKQATEQNRFNLISK